MYRISPFTYIVQILLASGLADVRSIVLSLLWLIRAQAPATCEQREFVTFTAPAGQTCGQYLEAYLGCVARFRNKFQADLETQRRCTWLPARSSCDRVQLLPDLQHQHAALGAQHLPCAFSLPLSAGPLLIALQHRKSGATWAFSLASSSSTSLVPLPSCDHLISLR